MPHSFHPLYYHFIWATRERLPLITRSTRPELLRLVREEAARKGGKPIRQNAVEDHVHLLVRLPPTLLVSEFIGQVKGAVSFRVNSEPKPARRLQWQEGYGVLTLRKDEAPGVCRYIDRQEEHHRIGRVSELMERLNVETDDWVVDPEASTPAEASPLKGAQERDRVSTVSQA